MPKRIFVLNGHPAQSSLSRTLAETYADAASTTGHDVRVFHLSELTFDMDFERAGYSDPKPLEADLQSFLDDLRWSEHVVLVTPMWWGGLPARLKGMIDRAFLPGKTFDTRGREGKLPLPMLKGRTGRVIFTSDTPGWFLRLIYGNGIVKQLRHQIFGFVGIRPTRFTHFSGASHPKTGQVDTWLKRTSTLGSAGA